MNRIPRPQEIYRHFKGNLYQIVTLAEDSENGQKMVVYQALYGEFKVYVRPLDMFVSKVDKVKYPAVAQEYRFEKVQAVNELIAEDDKDVIDSVENTSANATVEKVTNVSFAKEESVKACGSSATSIKEEPEEPALDPLVWEFLDADSHEKRLNILAALHHKITDSMITTMAIACDVEVPDGDLEDRYSQLKNCLMMLDRFEIKRK